MVNVYKGLLFEYTVRKKDTLYALTVKRVVCGQSFGHGWDLHLSRERMCELLHDLRLPDEFIKKVFV